MEWAFSDESERAQVMLLGVLFVPVVAGLEATAVVYTIRRPA